MYSALWKVNTENIWAASIVKLPNFYEVYCIRTRYSLVPSSGSPAPRLCP